MPTPERSRSSSAWDWRSKRRRRRSPRAATAGRSKPVTVIATDFPDAVPVLAALASRAPGESRFERIAHLRLKESDRIEAIASLLVAAGAGAEARADSLSVEGAADPPAAGGARKLPTFGDHRIAMAAALSLSRCPIS